MNETKDTRPVVLLVEDIDWIRAAMKRAVEIYGCRVMEATNASEAIRMTESDRPSLIFTEEELPTFDALMEMTQAHPSFKGLPVVIVNPDADEHTRYGNALVLTDFDQLPGLLTLRVKALETE